MNPILNVRISNKLMKDVEKHKYEDGFSNTQELVKTLLREYVQRKRKEELLKLWGSQKGKEIKDLKKLISKEFN